MDVAHGLDSKASHGERFLSGLAGASVHKPWGSNFLWGYGDLWRYLEGLACTVEPLSVRNYLGLSRVPGAIRPMVQVYLDKLPRNLLGTGFNPWMIALIHKDGQTSDHKQGNRGS